MFFSLVWSWQSAFSEARFANARLFRRVCQASQFQKNLKDLTRCLEEAEKQTGHIEMFLLLFAYVARYVVQGGVCLGRRG